MSSFAHAVTCVEAFMKKPETMPTLPWGGTPGGVRAEGETLGIELENASARALARYGFDVIQNPLDAGDPALRASYISMRKHEGLSHTRTADYIIEGRIFDNYAPESTNLQPVVDGIVRKVDKKQARRVVVNLSEQEGFLEGRWTTQDLHQALVALPHGGLFEVLVVYGNQYKPKVESVYPIKYVYPRPSRKNR